MTASGTYAFGPSVAEVVMQAFARLGIKRTAITRDHLTDAQMEMNLLFVEWANKGPNLWTVDLQSIPLFEGIASYAVDPATVTVLDTWITTGGTDRIITSVSRSEYASYSNKLQEGTPTAFWFDRTSSPTITIWPVADADNTYVLNFFRFRQSQDAALGGGQTPDVPYRWLNALVWGLAEMLAPAYAPDKLQIAGPKAAQSYEVAAEQDTENAPLTVSLSMGSYFR